MEFLDGYVSGELPADTLARFELCAGQEDR